MLHSAAFAAAAALYNMVLVGAEPPTAQAGMVVGRLRVAPASGRNAMIGIGNEPDQFQMGIDGSGNFIIASPRATILSVDNEDTMSIYANVSTSSLNLQGPLLVHGVPQFRTTHREDFSAGKAEGWDNPAAQEIVSSCAGISMLGGYGKFAKGEISKSFGRLPPHTELRVKATFHFIDAWVGETGFMRLDVGTARDRKTAENILARTCWTKGRAASSCTPGLSGMAAALNILKKMNLAAAPDTHKILNKKQ